MKLSTVLSAFSSAFSCSCSSPTLEELASAEEDVAYAERALEFAEEVVAEAELALGEALERREGIERRLLRSSLRSSLMVDEFGQLIRGGEDGARLRELLEEADRSKTTNNTRKSGSIEGEGDDASSCGTGCTSLGTRDTSSSMTSSTASKGAVTEDQEAGVEVVKEVGAVEVVRLIQL